MFRKKRAATTDDLPITEPPIDLTPETIPWDPAGTNTAHETPANDHNGPTQQKAAPPALDDPDLQEFLQAINHAKDAETEFVALNPEVTP